MGISRDVLLTILSEVGSDFADFESGDHLSSWLRIAPNEKITGGRVLSRSTPKGKNRLAQALKNMAVVIGNSKKDTELTRFFKRIAKKHGKGKAVVATARKVAVIIYNMVTKQEEYDPKRSEGLRTTPTIKTIKKKLKRTIDSTTGNYEEKKTILLEMYNEMCAKQDGDLEEIAVEFEFATT